jgi:hypothetical protein
MMPPQPGERFSLAVDLVARHIDQSLRLMPAGIFGHDRKLAVAEAAFTWLAAHFHGDAEAVRAIMDGIADRWAVNPPVTR